MDRKRSGRDKQPGEVSYGGGTENSIDALDQINENLGFVMETLKLVKAASLGREEWPDISLGHVTEEMLVRLERMGKLCNRFLLHESKNRRA